MNGGSHGTHGGYPAEVNIDEVEFLFDESLRVIDDHYKSQSIDPAITELENKQINDDLLKALESMAVTFGNKNYMTRDLDPEITTEAVLIKARNAIIKAKGLNP